MVKCGRCQGAGFQDWDEDGRPVRDVCYRCAGSGEIDEESARALQLEQVAGILASQAVEARREASNANPDGEGWAFAAAESMMSEREYTTAMQYDYQGRFMEEIGAMSPSIQEALIRALIPKSRERCPGRFVNGPDKRYARCDTCGRIDYECNEGDACGADRQAAAVPPAPAPAPAPNDDEIPF